MAKRRQKKRTHKKVSEEELAKIPRSMVLRLGSSLKNHTLGQLIKDFRLVMQPHTAIKLKENKSNHLKDFVVMAGPLGVSDLFIFKQSEGTGNISLRIAKMPHGPTLQFKINHYSLAKDIAKILKHPKSISKDSVDYLNPPLLVMNGFSNKVKELKNHEQLLVRVFQNLFPPINPQQTKVTSIKRVLMINRDESTGEIDLRHYAIDTKLVEGNRNVKKLIASHHNQKKKLPNLSKTEDISQVLLDPYSVGAMTSDSEVEDDAIVEVQTENQTSVKRRSEDDQQVPNTKRKAIKLTEIGPRINMSLFKIEEGVIGSSKTIYHNEITKDSKEVAQLEERHKLREKLKRERREKQQENVKAKFDKKKAKKDRKKAREDGLASTSEQHSSNDESSIEDEDEDEDAEENKYEIKPEDYEVDSDLYSDVEV